PYYLNSTRQSETSETWSTITKGWSWQVENTLAYMLDVRDRHHFNFLLGQSASMAGDQYVSGTSYVIRDPSQPWIDATDQDAKLRSASGAPSPQSRLASLFGRVGYNFDERYLFEFTIRRDGSSKFSPENKWANFPSVSAGWNITNEPFMERRPLWLTYMKLRASWGKNGNQNIRSFAYTSMMNGGANYIFGLGGQQAIVPGIVPGSYSNAGLRWEESEQTDVGLDMRFFNNSLAVTLDYYNKRTNGMLMEMALPGYIGNNRPLGNVGDMKNEGFEFDISFNKRFGDVNFRAGINGSYNRNKVVKLGNETGSLNYDVVQGTLGTISRAENGEPFPFFYGWKTAGIFQNTDQVRAHVNSDGVMLQPDAQPGDVIFVDFNGDGVIDDADRTKLGKGMPDWTFGLSLSAEWRGIDFSMLLHATVGNDIYDATRRADYPQVNMPRYMLDRWCGPGTSDELPRLTAKAGGNQNWRSSDLFVHDGDFLRCRSMQLGYTLPQGFTRKFFVDRLRLYVGAENLFTLTRYHGFDPEISSGGTSLGIDKGVYPQARTFLLGLNVNF
ncbi:MAG: SusC/RagA family TonB-linked outer membrane protein, partial [Muribaculaceae bacterium]|nr:SusC/RagA family TonB-linked outer membrane protein [Muribaculaceae bacterium]